MALRSFIPGGANQPPPEPEPRPSRVERPDHALMPGEADAVAEILHDDEVLRPAAPPTAELSAPHSPGGSHSH
jgi:hypothetical protein